MRRTALAALAATALVAGSVGVTVPAVAEGLVPFDDVREAVGLGSAEPEEEPEGGASGPAGEEPAGEEPAPAEPAPVDEAPQDGTAQDGTVPGTTSDTGDRPAAEPSSEAASTAAAAASPVSSDALPTVQINGVVWAQAVVGDRVYVGGSFTTARPAGAAPGEREVSRRNLLAYDLHTGELVESWAPAANGQVKDLAVSPDGTRLYAVGQFTAINGTTRYRAASFNTATGALTAFRPVVNAAVNTVDVRGKNAYLGGIFSTVNGTSRARLAAVDTSTGTTTRAFRATVNNRSVQDLVLSPDGSQLVIAGNFTSVNGSSNPGYGLARLATSGGGMLPLPVNASVIRNAGADSAILDLATDDDYFYGVGYHWNKKGTTEGSFAARWSDGKLVWLEDCHGDSYSIAPFGSTIFSASHKHDCSTSGGFPGTEPRHYKRATATTRTVEGTNTADESTGYPDNPGTPRPDILNWYPDFALGTFTGQDQGPWDVATADGYVLYGGEFPSVNGRAQQGLVRFAVREAAPNGDGPRANGAPFRLTATSPSGGTVRLAWPALTDRDDETLTYSVYRGTTSNDPVLVRERSARFWDAGSMTFSDSAPAGSTQRYVVVARDPWRNAAWSNWVTVEVGAG